MVVNMVTDKYANMISAFQCDFSLAKEGYFKLSQLDYTLKSPTLAEELIKDIELLEELEMGLRYGRLEIVEVEE